MVFKAVQGVVPPQGGLRQLWQSSATLNSDNPSAQTLTRSPNLVYKSANVEKWQSIPGFFIESVMYLIKWIRRVEWGNSEKNLILDPLLVLLLSLRVVTIEKQEVDRGSDLNQIASDM